MGPRHLRARRRLLTAVVLAALCVRPMAPSAASSFVPVPEIIIDPNEGNTYGILGAWLFLDERDEVRYMVAPDIRFNDTKGVFPTFRLYGYPTPTRRYALAAGKSTTKDENYEIDFLERSVNGGPIFVRGYFNFERDSTERFYGFGQRSDEDDESNYTASDLVAEATGGFWIREHVSAAYRMRIRRFGVSRGQVDGVPYILAPRFLRDPATDVRGRGAEDAVYWSHRLALSYDTRDSIDMPGQGAFSNLYLEAADRQLGSATSFVKFGFEGRGFIPLRGEKRNPVLAVRLLADWVSAGRDTPFWEMSSLGGRRALRGYGSDRFIDFNRALAGAELRSRVYARRLFGVMAELEIAPYIETGQVFERLSDSPVDELRWVSGIGFRGLVRPQIVAFVDVGYGDEGTAVFTGIDYPF